LDRKNSCPIYRRYIDTISNLIDIAIELRNADKIMKNPPGIQSKHPLLAYRSCTRTSSQILLIFGQSRMVGILRCNSERIEVLAGALIQMGQHYSNILEQNQAIPSASYDSGYHLDFDTLGVQPLNSHFEPNVANTLIDRETASWTTPSKPHTIPNS
jgi:hypothetical protein